MKRRQAVSEDAVVDGRSWPMYRWNFSFKPFQRPRFTEAPSIIVINPNYNLEPVQFARVPNKPPANWLEIRPNIGKVYMFDDWYRPHQFITSSDWPVIFYTPSDWSSPRSFYISRRLNHRTITVCHFISDHNAVRRLPFFGLRLFRGTFLSLHLACT